MHTVYDFMLTKNNRLTLKLHVKMIDERHLNERQNDGLTSKLNVKMIYKRLKKTLKFVNAS